LCRIAAKINSNVFAVLESNGGSEGCGSDDWEDGVGEEGGEFGENVRGIE
jgi:hypothetical protein